MIAIGFQPVGHEPNTIGSPVPLPELHNGVQQQAAPAQQPAPSAAPPHQDQNVPPANGHAPGPYGAPPVYKQEAPGGPPGGAPGGGYGQPPSGGAGRGVAQYGAPPAGQYGSAPATGQYGAAPGAPGGPGGWGGNRPSGGGGMSMGMAGPGAPGGSYMGRAPATGPAPQYNMGGSGPVVRDQAPPRIMPIAAVNQFAGRWAIKARVTAKGEMKRCVAKHDAPAKYARMPRTSTTSRGLHVHMAVFAAHCE